MTIEIDLTRQQLRYAGHTYAVSTSKFGAGEKNGSFCTPRGSHIVRAKIGAGQPLGAVFVRRRPTGEVWTPELHERYPGRDWILTRMRNRDVAELFDLVPPYTPVEISG